MGHKRSAHLQCICAPRITRNGNQAKELDWDGLPTVGFWLAHEANSQSQATRRDRHSI